MKGDLGGSAPPPRPPPPLTPLLRPRPAWGPAPQPSQGRPAQGSPFLSLFRPREDPPPSFFRAWALALPHQASGASLGTEGVFSFQREAGLGGQHGWETRKGLEWP